MNHVQYRKIIYPYMRV